MIRIVRLEGKQHTHAARLNQHWHVDEEAKRFVRQALLTPSLKFVCLHGDVPVGAVAVELDNSRYVYTERGARVFDEGFPVLKVSNLGSLQRGLGTQLMRKVETEAAVLGVSIVVPTTEASAGFYKKLGYSFKYAIAYKS